MTKLGLGRIRTRSVLDTTPFADVFGPKRQRKRVKITSDDFDGLAANATESVKKHLSDSEKADSRQHPLSHHALEPIFNKGQSRRIWNELHRVLDSSDVILHVLDARDPLGTWCSSIEKYMKNAPHKHLVFVLNKIDLGPTRVAAQWVRTLSKEVPTLAVRSSMMNPFGKGSLIALLRQFANCIPTVSRCRLAWSGIRTWARAALSTC